MKPKKAHPLDKKSSPKTPNVRSASQRKLAKDGTSWTPTEKLKRDRLMQQFAKKGRKGYGLSGNSEEYRNWYDRMNWGSCKCAITDGPCGYCVAQKQAAPEGA